jgi:hypothetical protein
MPKPWKYGLPPTNAAEQARSDAEDQRRRDLQASMVTSVRESDMPGPALVGAVVAGAVVCRWLQGGA